MTAILEARHLRKRFGGNEAVKDVSFTVNEGECVVLAGDNGAGKSTVIKMISGVYSPTGGEVHFQDQRLTGQTPNAIREAGIETIYQDLALADNLDPGLNLYLGREATRRILGIPFVARKEMRETAKKVLSSLGIVIPDPSSPVRDLSGGQRQAIAIARAIHWKAKARHYGRTDSRTGRSGTARGHGTDRTSEVPGRWDHSDLTQPARHIRCSRPHHCARTRRGCGRAASIGHKRRRGCEDDDGSDNLTSPHVEQAGFLVGRPYGVGPD